MADNEFIVSGDGDIDNDVEVVYDDDKDTPQ